jgi:hypothetical protein
MKPSGSDSNSRAESSRLGRVGIGMARVWLVRQNITTILEEMQAGWVDR